LQIVIENPQMGAYNIALGRAGEERACQELKKNGYKIIGHNYKTKFGEIDIIAEDKGELVFIEVRTRERSNFIHPAETVTCRKQKHLLKAAEVYLKREKPTSFTGIRFDVVAITLPDKVEIIKNAFFCEKLYP
jgi:putative endonuclease